MAKALMTGKKLSVTGLGRAICNHTYPKHNIKRVDRLIGNAALYQERSLIYQAMASLIIGQQTRPVILIDWSDLSANREFHLLRAAIPVDGRALTIYEESHHQRYEGNPRVHRRFLTQIKAILPENCQPIIVSDAGFRTPWFRTVQAMGWDYVGRIGGHTLLSEQDKEEWQRVEHVFETASTRGRDLGPVDLVRHYPFPCYAYLIKKKKLGRIKRTVFGSRCKRKHSEENARRERTPWLIVTSMGPKYINKQQLFGLYETRMQIEEGFRDIKNTRWGFAFNEARCSATYRYDNLLLVAHVATFAVWLIGQVAQLKGWQRRYQANTVKHEKVLSTFFLGLEVIRQGAVDFAKSLFVMALKQLYALHKQACGYV